MCCYAIGAKCFCAVYNDCYRLNYSTEPIRYSLFFETYFVDLKKSITFAVRFEIIRAGIY